MYEIGQGYACSLHVGQGYACSLHVGQGYYTGRPTQLMECKTSFKRQYTLTYFLLSVQSPQF